MCTLSVRVNARLVKTRALKANNHKIKINIVRDFFSSAIEHFRCWGFKAVAGEILFS